MRKYLWILLLIGLILSACSPRQVVPLVGTWKLMAYGPKEAPGPAVPDAEATLTFGEDGRVSGNDGCNSLGGTYRADDHTIAFSAIASTLMACDDARMAQEQVVTQVLTGNVDYEITMNTLTLSSKGMMLVFTAIPVSYPNSYPNTYPYP